MSGETFDVFLSHNSKDKPAVRRIAKALKDRGLKVWLDEWELIPGRRWIPELEKAIETTKSAAVLVGESGLGPWEQPEYEGSLSEFVDRGLPVIPVLLPGAPDKPKLPLFLKGFGWVDLRGGITKDGLDRLVWGITGKRSNGQENQAPTGLRVHNLPFLPLGDLLKGRDEELQRLIANLQSPAQATAITQAIHGLGGIGKTRLAVEYAWRSGDRYDKVLFVVADSAEALRSGLASLARPSLLALPEYGVKTEAETVDAVLRWFRESSRWLLILDNVDTEGAVQAVREVLPELQGGHVLITSRSRNWPENVKRQSLATLSLQKATEFLLQRTPVSHAELKRDTRLLLEEKGVGAALRWLQDNRGWLIILGPEDSVKSRQAVLELLPHLTNGHLLITSRQELPAEVWNQPLGVEGLSREFLLQRTDGERTNATDDADQAGRLAELLGGLPLALEQAAAYIVHHQTTFAGYLAEWERERQRVLEWHDETIMNYPAPLAATWQKTFCQLTLKAAAILRLTAFLAPEPIPEALFEEGEALVDEAAKFLGEETGRLAMEQSIQNALAELATYSLVARSAGLLIVHRIVQEILRTRVPDNRRRDWIERSLRLVNNFSPPQPDDVRTWPIWEILRPHAVRVVEEADCAGIPDPTARLMSQLAVLLLTKSLYTEAEPLLRRALQIDETSLDHQHPNVARDLNNLAQLLQATNRLAEAEPLMRRALQIDETSFGPHHSNVAIRLNNLASLLQATNRLSEAEPLMRQALQIDETSFGSRHPKVAIRLSNLALLLQATNRLSEAEPLMRRALQIDEASFGPHHPNVAIRLNNLALLLQDTNRLSEAEPLMRRTLEIDENSFGPHNPNVARDLNNLALLLQETNRLPEAEPLMRRALEIDEASYGTHHPDVAIDLNNLASLLQETNRLQEAEPFIRRAVAIYEASFGPDHPRTQNARRNLEILLREMGSGEPEA